MNKNLMELQSILRDSNILISFSGWFSQGIIEELGDAIKKHMQAEKSTKSNIGKVFGIFIEQTQNIRNYTVKKENSCNYESIANSGIVTIGKIGTEYFICSGNLVEEEDVLKLKEKLELLKNLNNDGLKKLYKDEIRKEPQEGSVSAGIGLIDIARKSSKPIEYSLKPIDDKFYFFQLSVVV
ncbi:SiaB family protein kinase [Clostridium thailandense]|uniref:Uncharacterized protein n=1 Tax=Clostridium thailandense TaxID=2794346 RepID=A0A949WR80_9CLOT|nr:SiaB family protein kinase [Clostridium thailandense]MBV7273651.1 hypothetical protein [Clostridium thailandense]MCH5137043.1 SiaB family protein kinase [Clostridiaceae bacterium UIB06]